MTQSDHDRCKLRGGGHFASHLNIRCRKQPIFELEPEFDESNSYLKFGRHLIKMTKLE